MNTKVQLPSIEEILQVEKETPISKNSKDAIIENQENDLLNYDYENSNLQEIKLFDFEKSREENLKTKNEYVLLRVQNSGGMDVVNPKEVISLQSECLVDFKLFEEHSSLEIVPVAYNSFMGIEVTNFLKYNSDFFTCDERVMFITLLVKYKCFGFKAFFWSKKVMLDELGIKKDRATKILRKFEELEILSSKVVKSMISNRPQQITYYDLDTQKIIELLPKIIKNYEEDECELFHDIKSYLKPGIKSTYTSKSQIMQ
ncbi:conserved hypothetical protein [Tenacibaculum maritimum]|uniref:hypothetical protein n=1 Tax=Tenacibaculum maritimum TaxID=107401 RepID=UPI0012E6777D|nr:hypothetical protein [Tenacibaculum maritimum]CAA0193777.1 conserved hypothetical protein [Tenacibaculum maritimum]